MVFDLEMPETADTSSMRFPQAHIRANVGIYFFGSANAQIIGNRKNSC
jgi:hypothetical protein